MSEVLPKTSFEVAKGTFEEYAAGPGQFLRKVAASLENENPLFLDGSLTGAVLSAMLAPEGHSSDAQKHLFGSYYRYECTARELKTQDKKIPVIGERTMQRSLEEVGSLTEGLLRTGADPDTALRRRVMRIERDDPEIGKFIRPLLSIKGTDAFIEGVHSTHLKFFFLNQSGSEQISPLAEPTRPSVLPVVRRSIIRSALLEIILDQNNIIAQTLTDAYKYIPGIVSRGIDTADHAQKYAYIYSLFASFTINGIMQELTQRDGVLPAIKEDRLNTHPDPAVNRALKENTEEANKLIREYNLRILDEIRNTNPHLRWGLGVLLNPLSLSGLTRSDPNIAITAVNGIVNSYSSLKTGLS